MEWEKTKRAWWLLGGAWTGRIKLMGPIETSIQKKISEQFAPSLFDLENESHKHASQLGQESHFRLVIVSELLGSLKRIDRSRKVHESLAEELKSIHALSLRIFSAEEWELLDNKESLASPSCVSKT